ncbi:hypothetical protein ACQUQU_08135 [Thalassolituus sp. LLYu03]|uniref:hypothetical protein n=1 Tax=Thalassolituus sp. LLYu03 TaxID=3421656 RepID=UPI003D2DFE1D
MVGTKEESLLTFVEFDVLERELARLDELGTIKLEAEHGLSEALSDLEGFKNQIADLEGSSLIEACKDSAINSISSQFGLASLFITAKDGGSVTTTHNFEKGITSSEADHAKYDQFIANNDGSRPWKEVRDEIRYDKPLPGQRKATFKTQETIQDAYTGKTLPKDGRAHIDHIVSAKEIESKAKAHLHMTPEQRAKMATDDANLAFTDASLNQSKGSQKMADWLDQPDKKTGTTKGKRFEVDREKALELDRIAREHIESKLNKEAIKKYSIELAQSGAADAARMAAYSALGVILREFTHEFFVAIKEAFKNRKTMSLREIFASFKERMSRVIQKLKENWKDIFTGSIEAGMTAFFSNLLVFSINLFATTLKKFVSMIRAGFVSLVQAIKIIANPPPGLSKEEARYQAVKIMTAGIIGAASLGLSAAIEKFLQAIPGLQPLMMFPVPIPGEPRTVSDIIAVTLSSILGGVLTTLVIYLMDSFRNQSKKDKLHIQLVYQSGVVVEYSTMLSWISMGDAFKAFFKDAEEQAALVHETRLIMQESNSEVKKSVYSYKLAIEKMKSRRN